MNGVWKGSEVEKNSGCLRNRRASEGRRWGGRGEQGRTRQDLSTTGKGSGFYSKNNGKWKHSGPDFDVSQLMFFCANQLHSWVARCREWLQLTLGNLLKGNFISRAPRRVRQCSCGAGRTRSRSGDLTTGVSVFSCGFQPIYICGSNSKLLWESIWLNSGLVSLGLQVIDGQCGEVKKSSIPWFIPTLCQIYALHHHRCQGCI